MTIPKRKRRIRRLAITDPVSSAAKMANFAAGLGVELVEVRSDPGEYPEVFRPSHRPDLYVTRVVHEGDVEATALRLRALGVDDVAVGADSGVVLGERLAEVMGTNPNDPAFFEARVDKSLQATTAAGVGLDVIPQALCSGPEAAHRFAARVGYPVFLKPPIDGGSHGQCLCYDPESLGATVTEMLSGLNLYGRTIRGVLVQAYIQGASEEVVDSATCAGHRVVTTRWIYHKEPMNGAPAIYREMEVAPFNESHPAVLYDLAFDAAMGQQRGGGHFEAFLRTVSGPSLSSSESVLLVEKNFRLPGAVTDLATACMGRDQVALTLASYLDPELFEELAAYLPPTETLLKHGKAVFLAAPRSGRLKHAPRIDVIEDLPSLLSFALKAKSPGDLVQRSVDVPTLAGFVLLNHTDPEIVERDLATLRRWENAFVDVEQAVRVASDA